MFNKVDKNGRDKKGHQGIRKSPVGCGESARQGKGHADAQVGSHNRFDDILITLLKSIPPFIHHFHFLSSPSSSFTFAVMYDFHGGYPMQCNA